MKIWKERTRRRRTGEDSRGPREDGKEDQEKDQEKSQEESLRRARRREKSERTNRGEQRSRGGKREKRFPTVLTKQVQLDRSLNSHVIAYIWSATTEDGSLEEKEILRYRPDSCWLWKCMRAVAACSGDSILTYAILRLVAKNWTSGEPTLEKSCESSWTLALSWRLEIWRTQEGELIFFRLPGLRNRWIEELL